MKHAKTIEKGILLLPLVISVLYMGFIAIDVSQPVPGLRLAPSKLDNLMNALFVFTLIYSAIVFLMLYKMGRLVTQIEKANKKHSTK